MAQSIPDAYRDLFEKRSFANLVTLMPDGSPQVTPVWVDFDGQYVLINSAKGRQKDRNMEARPQVAMDILDPENPYRYIEIRGHVAEITEEGAIDHINKLSAKYTGNPQYPFLQAGEVRQIYKIVPDKVNVQG
jgi:PPOX class probable F420-dependent enzyme